MDETNYYSLQIQSETKEEKLELEKRKSMTQKINQTDQNREDKSRFMIFKVSLTNWGAGTWHSLKIK